MNKEIPVNITFNPHKHHFNYLKGKFQTWSKLEWEEIEQEINKIGNNLIDLYTGSLNIKHICIECLQYLKHRNISNKKDYLNWLMPNEYKKISLSDGSIWVLKEGNSNKHFIHIHPAKYSPHSIRVRAKTLKTVIALKIFSVPIEKDIKSNLQIVNQVRIKYLKLSPIKTLHPETGILRLWKLFNDLK